MFVFSWKCHVHMLKKHQTKQWVIFFASSVVALQRHITAKMFLVITHTWPWKGNLSLREPALVKILELSFSFSKIHTWLLSPAWWKGREDFDSLRQKAAVIAALEVNLHFARIWTLGTWLSACINWHNSIHFN